MSRIDVFLDLRVLAGAVIFLARFGLICFSSARF